MNDSVNRNEEFEGRWSLLWSNLDIIHKDVWQQNWDIDSGRSGYINNGRE